MNKSIWNNIPKGTIVDSDIKLLAAAGELIIDEFNETRVKQACYELTSSDIFYDLGAKSESKKVTEADGFLLRPNCYVVSIVREKIRLPDNVLGRILSKGKLFSLGIVPVNTYADPGFEGRLGIVMYNGSQRHIFIRPGEPIAKIEFTILPKAVEKPYSGQHGYETEIWPLADHLFIEPNDKRIASRIGTPDQEIALSYGPRLSEMSRQLRYYRTGVWIQLAVMFGSFGILFWLHGQLPFFYSVSIGVLSNVLTAIGSSAWSDRRKWR